MHVQACAGAAARAKQKGLQFVYDGHGVLQIMGSVGNSFKFMDVQLGLKCSKGRIHHLT